MRARKIINIGIAAMVVVCSCGGSRGGGGTLDSDTVSGNQFNPNITYGSFIDSRDGKTYRTVVMPDGKTWMAENLNYNTADGAGSWCYDNDKKNCAKYGRLYDWNTAMTACPAGWHLPNDEVWEALADAVGGYEIAGAKLKSSIGWYGDDNDYKPSTNVYGFSALPGGIRMDKNTFDNIGALGSWWSAIEDDASSAQTRRMFYDGKLGGGVAAKFYGFSVRCILDD